MEMYFLLSPNRFEQLTVEDGAKESVNVGKYDEERQLKNHTLVKLT